MKKVLLCFAAGCVGGLISSITLWLLGDLGVCKKLGVAISPHLSAGWLYPKIVWGGIWGFLFVLPLLRSGIISRGFFFSLVPTCVQLFYFYPIVSNKGLLGLELGILTPVLIFTINLLWGITAVLTLKLAR